MMSLEQIKEDFITDVAEHVYRCTLCNQMQERGSMIVWVSDSAGFFKGRETYRSLVIGGKSGHKSGACFDCVRRYK